MERVINKQVKHCKIKCIGHIHCIYIELLFDNCVVRVNPGRDWFYNKGKNKLGKEEHTMPFYDFFKVFDIDCEDGAYFEDVAGKYCRAYYNEKGMVEALQHITQDIVVLVESLQ